MPLLVNVSNGTFVRIAQDFPASRKRKHTSKVGSHVHVSNHEPAVKLSYDGSRGAVSLGSGAPAYLQGKYGGSLCLNEMHTRTLLETHHGAGSAGK